MMGGGSFDSVDSSSALDFVPRFRTFSEDEVKPQRPLTQAAVSREALPEIVAQYPPECVIGVVNKATQFRPDPKTLEAEVVQVVRGEPSAFARTLTITKRRGGTLATTDRACATVEAQGDLEGPDFLHHEIAPLVCDRKTLAMVGRKRQLGAWTCQECLATNHEHVKRCTSCRLSRPFFAGQEVLTPFGKGIVINRSVKTGLYTVALSWNMGMQGVPVEGHKHKVLQKGVAKAYLNQSSLRDPCDQATGGAQESTKTVRFFTLEGSFEALEHFASWLPPVVANDRSIDILQLSYAGLGDVGAVALGSGLEYNEHIHTINLSGNDVGPDGARSLGRGLAFNPSVVLLSLENNAIGNEGAVALLQGLVDNTALEELRLDSNEIDEGCLEELVNSLGRNSRIRSLSLTCNGFSRRAGRLIREALACNHVSDGTRTFEVGV